MFIDECESVLGSRQDGSSGVSFDNELVESFLAEWDGLHSLAGQVFVIGATNRRDGLDNAVVSRFNQLIEIALPDLSSRQRILELEFAKCEISMTVSEKMAKETAGMSGRDIQNLALRFQSASFTEPQTEALFSQTVRAIRSKASTLVEDVSWDQVILPEKLKTKLQSLANKIKRAEEYLKMGLPVPKACCYTARRAQVKHKLHGLWPAILGLPFKP